MTVNAWDWWQFETCLHPSLSDGGTEMIRFLNVDAIDYYTFGNSKPFRIKIRNILNDNFVYFYVKKADASRAYGLEFEHMLSPYNLNFLVHEDTLVEEHIAGIPGDEFISNYLPKCSSSEKSQIAKQFVKFNERCMIRLLGDMRSYNYVIVPTHDFDQVVYKIRSMILTSVLWSQVEGICPQFLKKIFQWLNWFVIIWTKMLLINIKLKKERLSPNAFWHRDSSHTADEMHVERWTLNTWECETTQSEIMRISLIKISKRFNMGELCEQRLNLWSGITKIMVTSQC